MLDLAHERVGGRKLPDSILRTTDFFSFSFFPNTSGVHCRASRASRIRLFQSGASSISPISW